MDPEVKAFTPHDLKLTEDGQVVAAFAQTDAVDTDDDYTYPGFIAEGKEVPLSQYAHSIWPARGGTLPAGLGSLKEVDGWAVIAGQFFMETDQGRNTYHTVKAMGEHQQWSYGYHVTEKANPPMGVKARRGIKKADVFEVSPVFLGSQPTTHTMALKDLKSFGTDVSSAQYMIGDLARLIESESKRVAKGDASAEGDIGVLRAALASLRQYTMSTMGQVGSDEDLAEIAQERDAIIGKAMSNPDFVATFKEGALVGLPFTEASARVLGYVEDLTARATAIAVLRVKEGRAISTSRLVLLRQHHAALLAGADALSQLIEGAAPKPKSDEDPAPSDPKAAKMRMEAQLGIANSSFASLRQKLGVTQ